jgi:hypothetical protein
MFDQGATPRRNCRPEWAGELLIATVLLDVLASPSHANPVVVYTANRVGIGIGFVDVVLVEAIVLAWLVGRRFIVCLGASALANFVSAIPGVALFSRSLEDLWLLTFASSGIFLFQIAVSFLLSVLMEYVVLRLLWRKSSWQTIMHATFVANLVSYVLITPVLYLAPRGFIMR